MCVLAPINIWVSAVAVALLYAGLGVRLARDAIDELGGILFVLVISGGLGFLVSYLGSLLFSFLWSSPGTIFINIMIFHVVEQHMV